MPLAVRAGLLLSLALLLGHAWLYSFLCDDAFISFRYARNLAEGSGLVFNPGEAPVEGYTNFLWVLLLAAGSALGLRPEGLAPALSLLATVGLFALCAGYALRERGPGEPAWLVLVPGLLLATHRSVAVWSTSGLETRLFELLALSAALRLLAERRALGRGEHPRPLSALLLAGASWTRPEGILLAVCAACATLAWRPRPPWPWLRRAALGWALPVAGHLIFRIVYYGELVPNTFFVKVGPLGVALGLAYVELFALEYGLLLWLPLLWAGLRLHAARGTLFVPGLFASLLLPHLAYVVAIGGDHFEYRPLGLYLPFAFLILYDGARHLTATPRSRAAVGAWLLLLLAAQLEIPARSHLEFPARYEAAFPGSRRSREAETFLLPERGWLTRLPGARQLAQRHRDRLGHVTRHFAGIRAEEHAYFLQTVRAEAGKLQQLVATGLLPPDTRIAIDSVGIIPYQTRLPTLDRLGLTDRVVARSPAIGPSLVGHSKHASPQLARSAGVDLWAVHPVHLLWLPRDPGLNFHLKTFFEERIPAWFADAGHGLYLVAYLPQGIEHARQRFPRLRFRSVFDPAYQQELAPARR